MGPALGCSITCSFQSLGFCLVAMQVWVAPPCHSISQMASWIAQMSFTTVAPARWPATLDMNLLAWMQQLAAMEGGQSLFKGCAKVRSRRSTCQYRSLHPACKSPCRVMVCCFWVLAATLHVFAASCYRLGRPIQILRLHMTQLLMMATPHHDLAGTFALHIGTWQPDRRRCRDAYAPLPPCIHAAIWI